MAAKKGVLRHKRSPNVPPCIDAPVDLMHDISNKITTGRVTRLDPGDARRIRDAAQRITDLITHIQGLDNE